jgi:hypothetical protein
MKSRIKNLYKEFFASDPDIKWPCPDYNIEEEPHFLFIIAPSYSGSTALAQILNSSHATTFLHKRGEGQWLIPGMCGEDRWDRETTINWESVRSVWLQRIELIKTLVQDVELIIEKSPPNHVRIDQLIKVFPNHSLMAFNRNPYANCSSILFRNHDPENKSEEKRIKIVSGIADKWLYRSTWIKKWIDKWQIPNFSYEQFCAEPAACVSTLAVNIPALQTVDVNKSINVKDYKKQGIIDFNEEQISRLSKQEVDAISEVLKTDPELVSFFGYEILE